MSTIHFAVSFSGTLVLCLYLVTVGFLGWVTTLYMGELEAQREQQKYEIDAIVYNGAEEEQPEGDDNAPAEESDEQTEDGPSSSHPSDEDDEPEAEVEQPTVTEDEEEKKQQ